MKNKRITFSTMIVLLGTFLSLPVFAASSIDISGDNTTMDEVWNNQESNSNLLQVAVPIESVVQAGIVFTERTQPVDYHRIDASQTLTLNDSFDSLRPSSLDISSSSTHQLINTAKNNKTTRPAPEPEIHSMLLIILGLMVLSAARRKYP